MNYDVIYRWWALDPSCQIEFGADVDYDEPDIYMPVCSQPVLKSYMYYCREYWYEFGKKKTGPKYYLRTRPSEDDIVMRVWRNPDRTHIYMAGVPGIGKWNLVNEV